MRLHLVALIVLPVALGAQSIAVDTVDVLRAVATHQKLAPLRQDSVMRAWCSTRQTDPKCPVQPMRQFRTLWDIDTAAKATVRPTQILAELREIPTRFGAGRIWENVGDLPICAWVPESPSDAGYRVAVVFGAQSPTKVTVIFKTDCRSPKPYFPRYISEEHYLVEKIDGVWKAKVTLNVET